MEACVGTEKAVSNSFAILNPMVLTMDIGAATPIGTWATVLT